MTHHRNVHYIKGTLQRVKRPLNIYIYINTLILVYIYYFTSLSIIDTKIFIVLKHKSKKS